MPLRKTHPQSAMNPAPRLHSSLDFSGLVGGCGCCVQDNLVVFPYLDTCAAGDGGLL